MTIDQQAWINLEKIGGKEHIFPNGEVLYVPPDVEMGVGITLVIHDYLVKVRNTPIPQYFDENKQEIVNVNCGVVMEGLFKEVLETLVNTETEIYVICLDPIGQSRPEKAETAKKRMKTRLAAEAKGEPKELKMLPGHSRYFYPLAPFPGNMSLVFKTPEAKSQFYGFVVEYLGSLDFKQHIPEGKMVILSGAHHNGRNLSPLVFDRNTKDPVQEHDYAFPGLSEGDLDALRWVHAFPAHNFQIRSGDGDLLMIALLQMRFILQSNAHRKGWFVTSRVVGSSESVLSSSQMKLKEAQVKFHQAAILEGGSLEEAYQRSGGIINPNNIELSETATRKMWLHRYVDLTGFYNEIIHEAHRIQAARHVSIHNPVELFVLMLFLSSKSHDYVDCGNFAPGVGSQYIWNTYVKNMHDLGDLVRVSIDPHSASGSHDPILQYYIINTEVMRMFIERCYMEAGYNRIKPSKKNPEHSPELSQARRTAGLKLKEKNMPTRKVSEKVAAQAAWTLAYWGNGSHPSLMIPNGLEVDEKTGLSVFGFTPKGWPEEVVPGKIRCAPLYKHD